VSWYALEIKSGSIIHKQNYKLNDEHVENQLKLVIKKMNNIHYQRYEVSNWCMNPKYQSQHNKAYWLTRDWKAIGLGSCGFEKLTYYENVGSLDKWHPKKTHYTKEDYYFQIMLMGLRLKEGLNLNDKIFKQAYLHYANKLKHIHIKNNHLVVDDINLLDNTLLELM
jgi:oxygen-independent coproporphyrinogen-3 oxidase